MWEYGRRVEIRQVLGDAFLAGPWEAAALESRAREVLAVSSSVRWLRPLVARALEVYRERPSDRRREFHAWLDEQLHEISYRARLPALTGRRLFPVAEMGRMRWPVPPIATCVELAAFFDLHLGELDWLCDVRLWERTASSEQLRNYRYAWIPRAGGPPRLLEMPKRLLKETQRRLLHQILDVVPAHPDAHGFRRGHSPLTNARRHLGVKVVIGFDLEDFFASVSPSRIYGIFREAGYPEEVAHRLTGLSTNVVPHEVWARLETPGRRGELGRHFRLGSRLASSHLPQGAPSSPALANLAAFRLDSRLSALAAESGAVYSRYADDLTFSGGRRLLASAPAFRSLVAEIIGDEGFCVNSHKSRLATRAGRQVVTGIVVNERPNLARRDFDALKAAIHDAVRNGPTAANRGGVADLRSHLLGRIAWAETLNPDRGTRLRRDFAAIVW